MLAKLKLIWAFLDGWKSGLGYLLLQIPFVSTNPMLLGALQKALANPNDVHAWSEALAQLVLALGVTFHVLDTIKSKLG